MTLLLPVTAALWGVLVLGESVTAQVLVGGAIVLAGTALVLNLVGLSKRSAASAAREGGPA